MEVADDWTDSVLSPSIIKGKVREAGTDLPWASGRQMPQHAG